MAFKKAREIFVELYSKPKFDDTPEQKKFYEGLANLAGGLEDLERKIDSIKE